MTRRILPRKKLISIDNIAGTYPRTQKTGDSRPGNINSVFDDRNTPIYNTRAVVSYPTSLQVGSPALTSDLTSSIVTVGRVSKGVTEAWMLTNATHDSYMPFKEVGLHEQDINKSSAKYLSGSAVADVGMGFRGGLGEKTKLRFEFPIRTRTTLNALTASAYYLNTVSGQFDEAAPSEKTDPNPNNNPEAPFWNNYSPMPMDPKYFDPLGHYVMSGTHYGYAKTYLVSQSSPSVVEKYKKFYFDEFTNSGVDILSVDDPLSALRNPKFAADISQSIDLSQIISSPFLLEKATIELPFEAGPGWFNDRTQVASTLGGSVNGNAIQVGGPCITFAICNQISPTHRELIMSASIIPEGDNSGSITHSLTSGSSDYYLFRSAKGFPAFGSKPTVIVPSGSNSMFTGTLRFDSEARISNGVLYGNLILYNKATYASWTPATAPLVTYPTNVSGLVMFINPFGRAGAGNTSGRSIFGRERITPVRKRIPYLQTAGARIDVSGSGASAGVSGSAIDFVFYNGQGNAISPYLLMPTDKLVMVISKYHAAPIETPSWQSPSYFPLTSSHDVKIGLGTVRVTLYGSHVRNQTEYHDTLNQDVTSNAVHTIIGTDPVLDQWNIEATSTYRGAYTDNIITGSVYVSPANIAYRRGVIGRTSAKTSSIGESVIMSQRLKKTYEISSNNMFVQLRSPNERYWDTLLPGIDEIAKTNGASAWLRYNSPPGLTAIALDRNGPNPLYSVDAPDTFDGDFQFSKSYPFAPAYLNLPRCQAQGKRVKARWYVEGGVIDSTKTDDQLVGNAVTFRDVSSFYLSEWNVNDLYNASVPSFTPPSIEDAVRMYFGVGARNTMSNVFIAAAGYPNVELGTTQAPEISFVSDGTIAGGFGWLGGVRPVIRGWKYGIMNGLEAYTRCHFRRDKYGQFRDMLEQRLYGTIYETVGYRDDGTFGGVTGKLAAPVQVRFIGKDGTHVSPDSTVSSNMSQEATSSLPYFDGEFRNRLEINEARLGTTLVAPFVFG